METIYLGGKPTAGFGVGGLLVFAEDIEAEQRRMLATAQEVDAAVAACAAIDATTRSQWKSFFSSLSQFANQKVCNVPLPFRSCDLYATANTSDTVVAYEQQLKAWGQKLATCPDMPPQFNVTPSKPVEPPSVTDALKYIAIGVSVVGGVYVVSQVIAVLPRRSKSR